MSLSVTYVFFPCLVQRNRLAYFIELMEMLNPHPKAKVKLVKLTHVFFNQMRRQFSFSHANIHLVAMATVLNHQVM